MIETNKMLGAVQLRHAPPFYSRDLTANGTEEHIRTRDHTKKYDVVLAPRAFL